MEIKTTSQIHDMQESAEKWRPLQSKASLSKRKWVSIDNITDILKTIMINKNPKKHIRCLLKDLDL